MASPTPPVAFWVAAVLVTTLALAGCGAPKHSSEPGELAPLPAPLHAERSIVAEFEAATIPPVGPCGPATACMDHPFTLPRRALVVADVTWTNAVGAMTLELMRDGDLVASDAEGTAEGTRRVGFAVEADAGDYVVRVRATDMVNDRYVLDVTFQEIVPSSGRPDARGTTEAHAAIATRMSGVPCEIPRVDPATTSENLVGLAQVNYTEGAHGELDARDGWLVATADRGGFELVDVSDPLAPLQRGRYLPDSGASFDTKWMPDGKTVVVGQTTKVDLVDVSSLLSGEAGGDFLLLDSWDYESAGPTDRPHSMHMLAPARIGGTDWVFVATMGNAGVAVLKLDDETRTLSLAGRIGNDAFGGGPNLGPHDASLIVDEFTGHPLLYVANGHEGWRVFDVSDPTGPLELANVLHPFGYNFVHNVVAQKVDGRRLVAVSEEGFGSVVTVYDATDWSSPQVVGIWTVLERDPLASAHNIQIVDGLLYVAYYRAGAFVFDLHDLGSTPTSMEPIAHFEPPFPTGLPVPGYGAYLNNIWDFIVHRGVVYASDIDAGTYVLGFGCLAPGDEAASSHN